MDAIIKPVRNLVRYVLRGAPLKPAAQVQTILQDLKIMPKHLNILYAVFSRLRQAEKDETTICTASEVSTKSILDLVSTRKRWVNTCLERLCEFGACYETMEWNHFLHVFLKFNSLSKVELCQTMFYIIVKDVKSWTIHYLTCSQLQEYYDRYRECPVASFNTREIAFARLPLHRYYIADFVELCHRYSQLINPLLHLQRSLQSHLPGSAFWNDYDRVECYNRRISLEFFRMSRGNIFLRGSGTDGTVDGGANEPAFRESGQFLVPDTLGAERVNIAQWGKRMGHYNHRQGVWPQINRPIEGAHGAANKDKNAQQASGGPILIDVNNTNMDLGPVGNAPRDSSIAAGGAASAAPPGAAAGAGGAGAGRAGPGGGGGNDFHKVHFALPELPENNTNADGSQRTEFVPDTIRLGQAPMNNGINNEMVFQPPASVSSAEIKRNITLTLGGQYSRRMPAQIGGISELPKWMLQYVTVPSNQGVVSNPAAPHRSGMMPGMLTEQKKRAALGSSGQDAFETGKDGTYELLNQRTHFERMQETDFIKSMRASVTKQPALVDRMQGANRVPLVPRPNKEFHLMAAAQGSMGAGAT